MRRRAARFTRACVCASAISLAVLTASGAAATAPQRVASLNLCTDELVLLIAAPGQIVSVTHLARSRHEFALWRTARRYRANDGSVVSVAGMHPDLIVTMGGLGRDRDRLARRIGAEIITLPFPQSLNDLESAIDQLADALGREARGQQLLNALRGLRASRPRRAVDGLFLSSGGLTLADGSLGAQWLRLAGVDQPQNLGGRIAAERLLTDPPSLVVLSDYRSDQASRGNFWPGYRLIEDSREMHTIATDGRRWTCAGPTLIPEILRLRRRIAR